MTSGTSPEADAGEDARSSQTTDSSTGCDAGGDCGSIDTTQPLVLAAYGGPAGAVAAEVLLDEPGVGVEKTCAAPTSAGACVFTSCRTGGVGSPGAGYGDYGPITASVGATAIALDYDSFGYPTEDFPSSIALETGQTMTFRGGNGAGVPVFDVTATIPGLAILTSPAAPTDGSRVVVDTTRDLSLTWGAIPAGQVTFEIENGAFNAGATALSVTCTFAGSAGSGVVPQALLASMKGMSSASSMTGSFIAELDTTTVVGGLTVVTKGYQYPPTNAGSFGVTLE